MIEVGFLHPDQAPTPEAHLAFPCDVPLPSSKVREKIVVIFHDESTFNTNDDQSTQWVVYRARTFLALVLYARGEGSSSGHV